MIKRRMHVITRNSLIYILLTIIQKGISFLLVPIYSFLISPAEFGVVNVVVAIGAFYTLLFSFAIDDSVSYYYFILREKKDERKVFIGTIVTLSILISIVATIGLWYGRGLFYRPFLSFDVTNLYIVLGIISAVTPPLFGIMQKILIMDGRAGIYSFTSLLYSSATIGFSILFVLVCKFSALGVLMATTIVNSIAFISSATFLYMRSKIIFKYKYAKMALNYSKHLVPNRIASWGTLNFNRVFIGNSISEMQTGIYNMGANFSSSISIVGNSIAHALQPWVYQRLEDGSDASKERIMTIVNLLSLGFIFCAAMISLFSKEVFNIMVDKRYHEALRYLPIMAFAEANSCFTIVSIFILFYSSNRTRCIMIGSFINASINILLCIVLVPKIGVIGTSLASYVSNTIRGVYLTYKINFFANTKIPILSPILISLSSLLIVSLSDELNIPFVGKLMIVLFFLLGGWYYRYRTRIGKV